MGENLVHQNLRAKREGGGRGVRAKCGGSRGKEQTCRCGRMICTECELSVFGMGWLMRHMARTTLLVFRTLSGK